MAMPSLKIHDQNDQLDPDPPTVVTKRRFDGTDLWVMGLLCLIAVAIGVVISVYMSSKNIDQAIAAEKSTIVAMADTKVTETMKPLMLKVEETAKKAEEAKTAAVAATASIDDRLNTFEVNLSDTLKTFRADMEAKQKPLLAQVAKVKADVAELKESQDGLAQRITDQGNPPEMGRNIRAEIATLRAQIEGGGSSFDLQGRFDQKSQEIDKRFEDAQRRIEDRVMARVPNEYEVKARKPGRRR